MTRWSQSSPPRLQWKSAHAVETDARSLEEALVRADVFLVKGPINNPVLERIN